VGVHEYTLTGTSAAVDDGRWQSGVSGSYWIATGLTLLVGGLFIAIKINIAGLLLCVLGLLAFWMASRARSWL
jgi:hypothetical protein